MRETNPCVQQGITAVIFTWKEIVGSGIALVMGAIAIMQLPMFKTDRQKQDELLTPDQRKRIAMLALRIHEWHGRLRARSFPTLPFEAAEVWTLHQLLASINF